MEEKRRAGKIVWQKSKRASFSGEYSVAFWKRNQTEKLNGSNIKKQTHFAASSLVRRANRLCGNVFDIDTFYRNRKK